MSLSVVRVIRQHGQVKTIVCNARHGEIIHVSAVSRRPIVALENEETGSTVIAAVSRARVRLCSVARSGFDEL